MERDLLEKMYKTMLTIRKFEEKVGDFVLEEKVKTPCHLYVGEEAIAAGTAAALNSNDYIFGNHRSHGHYIAKGGDIKKLAAEIFCKKTGCSKGKGGSMHIVAPEVGVLGTPPIVAASIPIAVGAALSASLRKNDRVSVSFFGDGAVNEGVFYESLNFASLRKLPVIFVCENNSYATHMPSAKILANTNIARKADAFRIPGITIDGNDAITVYRAVKEAVERARRGKGPSLIECKTYRWRGHVGPDDNIQGRHTDIRPREELEKWIKKDPIKRIELVLNIGNEEKEEILREIKNKINEAVIFAENSPYPQEEDLSKGLFRETV